jgi:microcin C transport system substrate-binding protein
MIESYRSEFNEDKKAQLSRDIQQRIYDLAVMLPTFSVPYFRTAYWSYLKLPKHFATKTSDSAFSPFSPTIGGLFWIDSKLKKAVKKKKNAPGKPMIDKIETYRTNK